MKITYWLLLGHAFLLGFSVAYMFNVPDLLWTLFIIINAAGILWHAHKVELV